MKVAFFEPYTLNTPHFERCLEVMQQHLDQGDEVLFLGCDADFLSCDVNHFGYSAICKACIQKKEKGFALIDGEFEYQNFKRLSEAEEAEIDAFIASLSFEDVDTLKGIKFQEFDVGYAVASSLISNLRTPHLNINRLRNIINNYLKDSLIAFVSLKHQIEQENIERIYVLNGRRAQLRAAVRAATAKGIDFFVHETSNRNTHYCLTKNALPHSIKAKEQEMKELWENADKATRRQVGAQMYEDRVKGNLPDKRFHHTAQQNVGQLPANWDDQKHNIVFFNTSEDEFAAIGDEWETSLYPSQIACVSQLAKELEAHKDVHFYLRMHPNLRNAKKSSYEAYYDIKTDNFTIIEPTATVSTYALVENADKIVTFSSTVGIEAAFRKKPAVILGPCMYKNLGSTHNPSTHAETMSMLLDKDLPPKDTTGALIFGYYLKNRGIPYELFEAESYLTGKFKGVRLEPDFFTKEMCSFFLKLQGLRKKYL